MKILHVSNSEWYGGAARSALRLHLALLDIGIQSHFLANVATTSIEGVIGERGVVNAAAVKFRRRINAAVKLFHQNPSSTLNSYALFSTKWRDWINKSEYDVINLHWIAGEMLSISDIGALRKPVVWTLHDMWAICGSEHVAFNDRWRFGYKDQISTSFVKFDLDRWTYRRKQKYWRKPIQLVCPSAWLAKCVTESPLLKSWPVQVIKNPINTEFWKPVDKSLAKQVVGVTTSDRVILFGSMTQERHKGYDLLRESLNDLAKLCGERRDNTKLLIVGDRGSGEPVVEGFSVIYTGNVEDDSHLRTIYSAADVAVVPSRIDNLPNVALEAMACGTPIVAFDVCGLPEMISHLDTGYLAQAFSVSDLAAGINSLLNLDSGSRQRMSDMVRNNVVRLYSDENIATAYLRLYETVGGDNAT